MKLTVSPDDSVSDVLSATTTALVGAPDEVAHECQIIVDEFMANMKFHVLPHAPDINWVLELDKSDSDVTIKFRYSGEKFDPTPATTSVNQRPIEQREIGGLGLVLISSLSDEQHYHYHDGVNEWTIKKHF
ncbi:MAG: ATP-binding protein [Marinobacter sp.]